MIAASTTSSFGVNLQKKSHTEDNKRLKLLTFLTGILCMIISAGLDFLALSFLSQLEMGILASFGLIINFIVSQKAFSETVSIAEKIAIVCLGVGITLAIYGSHSDHIHEPNIIIWSTKRCSDGLFIIYISILFFLLLTKLKNNFIPFVMLASIFGSTMLFFAKYISVGLNADDWGDKSIKAVLSTMICAIFHIYFYNKALAIGSASIVMPIHQCFWILGCFFFGFYIFAEELPVDKMNRDCLMLGFYICACGLVIIIKEHALGGAKHSAVATSNYNRISSLENEEDTSEDGDGQQFRQSRRDSAAHEAGQLTESEYGKL